MCYPTAAPPCNMNANTNNSNSNSRKTAPLHSSLKKKVSFNDALNVVAAVENLDATNITELFYGAEDYRRFRSEERTQHRRPLPTGEANRRARFQRDGVQRLRRAKSANCEGESSSPLPSTPNGRATPRRVRSTPQNHQHQQTNVLRNMRQKALVSPVATVQAS
ncbi:expressed unknown protein [Seminavis robusta]|uniref:Uncharacterized protein n=1 Tax=Seminavis robusta TaxID=568900 RepID=A0A9N8DWS3_9STRA|nr:expressed unknown protein [Seminavis robusta]|eukprot:Sro403_g135740.1 n/a (164) ;mRNA; r:51614-52105